MSSRSRASKAQQHVHCDSCYNRRCRARVEVSVSCAVIPCRLHCGALFHLCKEEDHLLLCPNVRVPCLNAGYGCSLQLPRSSQAAHLQVCPASVVCCTMDWLRFPTDETNPHSNIALQQNLMKEIEGQGEALDLAMALVDQTDLYDRLKMKPLYPELMEEEEEEEIFDEKGEETAVGGLINGAAEDDTSEELCTSVPAAEESPGNYVCTRPDTTINLENYNLCEMMFGMERGACAVAQATLDDPKQNPKHGGKATQKQQDGALRKNGATEKDGATADKNCPQPDTSKTGLAPWQEGVLERLQKELTPQEYNMYVVHHGRMLVSFGQIAACTPREKDFVYGSLEPIPVQTLRSFKVPDSYHYRRRVHLYDTAARAQSETRCVDTSDLGASEEDWFIDEAEATLLGYAEEAVMGHKISQPKSYDGLYNDVGTQTYSFRTAPFKRKTTLAEVMVDKQLKLRLELQAESVNNRHNRANCVFTYLCGHTFHRRELATHFRNVHSDIQTGLSGWFEQRCPLAYLGCTYSQKRFHPSTHKATVYYNKRLRTFNLRPTLEASEVNDSQSKSSADFSALIRRGQSGGEEDSLSCLPYEVLCHMASFLDSLSLSQLALVSKLMRQVCWSLLQERGMITLRWERKADSTRPSKWKAKPVWEFSHLFSPVDSWHMADIPPISAHLKVCPYYETSLQSERIPLPSMSEKQGSSQERISLVNHFTRKRWQQ
ncbi:F-box only protein 40-like [Cheilinus undulatus]|uniref:F-box only protein 40-like n=1 Tax=Cheilinus undulatus TaxID=241271 RepID=UPI001BD32372|nr:F-box only protein 40-like [Cheilinus undulatus]XP_041657331.1 F-box only protein 40-like [Cheilinus undulatus]XP_041657332.1 F-box only protein 40-like [Cheilinus undulatus]XP_041657333.1 F-box only protein 40-like [Cheilinus undulatus]XP_041657334.1 F-box only protein 40-like [Cheilinus undulatus]XP_041657335.1 F-box only protein 40-like [Cheilinus undulatus]XP_041657337.1 F-box only protein 40-like [Cheilinus undulatus]